MDLARLSRILREQCDAVTALVGGASDDEAGFRPEDGGWSLVEVVCHLADEERDDFRTRVDLTLHRPGEAWPAIDPEGWVTERRYADRALCDALSDYRAERERSLAWLAELRDPDWTLEYEHPVAGTLRAGDVFASWVVHDALHLRQIGRLRRAWIDHVCRPFDTAYAG